MKKHLDKISILLILVAVCACANIGRPDGGPFDETPPRLLKSSPAQGGTNVDKKKLTLEFDEFVNLEGASEKVVLSPPQNKQAEVKSVGKKVIVQLLDTLQKDATYTMDFGDAIVDFTEGNALENFVLSFSTGNAIDTMELSGTVLNAADLEPKKGLLVGLYTDLSDTAFTTKKMERIGRTDSRGQFRIRGVKPGNYRIYALMDNDQNYMFSQKNEDLAFLDSVFVPTCFEDTRFDTVWIDTLTIDTVKSVKYTHYLPDNIMLRAFQEEYKTPLLQKSNRDNKEKFTLYFNTKMDSIPTVEGLNFDAKNAFLVESCPTNDTITYWMPDSMLYNTDTLQVAVTYTSKDSLFNNFRRTDTIKAVTKKIAVKKKKKKDEEEAPEPLGTNMPDLNGAFDGYKDIAVLFSEPLDTFDRKAMRIQVKNDTIFEDIPFNFEKDSMGVRAYKFIANWEAGRDYQLVIDSAAFTGIYGHVSDKVEKPFRVRPIEEYGMIVLHIPGLAHPAFVEMLNASDKPQRRAEVVDSYAEFNFLPAGKYYFRLCIDRNGNGVWDTGNFEKKIQPEEVYYYNAPIELKALWTIEQDWDYRLIPLDKQKPDELKTQKPDEKKKTTRRRTYQGR